MGDASSTAGSVSEEQTESSTQITCGSGATSLEGFCSSVVMNENQNAIPKMLSVGKLVPIWSIMEQVDPWIGSGTQNAPEITHELIKETADAAKQRFKDLTTVKDSDAMCNTAGNLMPPGEDGVCAFNGKRGIAQHARVTTQTPMHRLNHRAAAQSANQPCSQRKENRPQLPAM